MVLVVVMAVVMVMGVLKCCNEEAGNAKAGQGNRA